MTRCGPNIVTSVFDSSVTACQPIRSRPAPGDLTWDQSFFELAKHGASHLRFDLQLYRSLDPASRRLFLFVSKIFHRRDTLPRFDLRDIAVDVLGFSVDVAMRDLRMKVLRCLNRLEAAGVVNSSEVTRIEKNRYVVSAFRGSHFDGNNRTAPPSRDVQPVLETLLGLGFEPKAAHGLIRRYPTRLLEEWADITQAKIERQGLKSFRRSPMAYLVDSVSKAHKGLRTAPDWWDEVRRSEARQAALSNESQKVFNKIRSELFSDTPTETARISTGHCPRRRHSQVDRLSVIPARQFRFVRLLPSALH